MSHTRITRQEAKQIADAFPHHVDFCIRLSNRELVSWCEENFGLDAILWEMEAEDTEYQFYYDPECTWTFLDESTYFKRQEDMILFILHIK